jgi:hypothetical protein
MCPGEPIEHLPRLQTKLLGGYALPLLKLRGGPDHESLEEVPAIELCRLRQRVNTSVTDL